MTGERTATLTVPRGGTTTTQGVAGEALAFYMDGTDLRTLAIQTERPFVTADNGRIERAASTRPLFVWAGSDYTWFTADAFSYWMKRETDTTARLWFATCSCGEPGCWPLEADLKTTPRAWRLSLFSQPHRPWWTYEALGTLVFDRSQVEAAFTEAGLVLPEPREWPRRRSPLPPIADVDTVELAGWGYGQHLDIRDLVNAALGLERGDVPGRVSPTALTLAAAIGANTGTTGRQRLKQFVGPLLGSGADTHAEAQRHRLVAAWYFQTFVPAFLKLSGTAPAPTRDAWIAVRNQLRGRRATLGPRGGRSRVVGKMRSSTGWDEPPGVELLRLPRRDLAVLAGEDEELSRIAWSAGWYAAVLALAEDDVARFREPMRQLLDSAYELLAELVR